MKVSSDEKEVSIQSKAKSVNNEQVEESDFRYERMDKLGEGTYGIVYKSRDKETNEVSFFSKQLLSLISYI
jgi:serine/threonine protein kinase